MYNFFHQLIQHQAEKAPQAVALWHKDEQLNYAELWQQVEQFAQALQHLGLRAGQRVAVYLPKQFATVVSLFAPSLAGGIVVPINPALKAAQVQHILQDCDVSLLITHQTRAKNLATSAQVVLIDETPLSSLQGSTLAPMEGHTHDTAAILYTSGSSGKPKGVVLSHQNLLLGAASVAEYLHNTADDCLLAALPLSFDYGLSQLTTAFHVGASVVLLDYLLPQDIMRALEHYPVSGLAAVPPLWQQLAKSTWPDSVRDRLRYITNSGGAMPVATTQALQAILPNTNIYLMYGLTEAFRSTYLEPAEVTQRPTSMGKAIPYAEVQVVRPDGSLCDDNEAGELVHSGPLVAKGYWQNKPATAQRFKQGAVWSGDLVKRDAKGYLYFIGRNDALIKTSGYRISPDEVEDIVLQLTEVNQAAVIGVPHPLLGQAIVLLLKGDVEVTHVKQYCQQQLANYMQPQHIALLDEMPLNSNGKIDRILLAHQYQNLFTHA
jgi:acyl-CoA ligase (AMP-forming) (exosortase A-associated)